MLRRKTKPNIGIGQGLMDLFGTTSVIRKYVEDVLFQSKC